jgi:hypothetical protein
MRSRIVLQTCGALLVVSLGCQRAGAEDPASGSRDPKGSPSVQTSPGQPGPQSSSDAPENVPELGLSASQKQTIYQSIRNQQAKKSPEPIGFRSAVGAHVPDAIEVSPLPKTIVELIPKMRDYRYAFVANEVLIVDPQLKTVVEVIRQ